jgi:hypothetical protein
MASEAKCSGQSDGRRSRYPRRPVLYPDNKSRYSGLFNGQQPNDDDYGPVTRDNEWDELF